MIADHRIVHFDRQIQQPVGIVAALPVSFAQLRIQECGVLRRVDLDVGAAQANQLFHFIAQDIDQIGEVGVDGRISPGGFSAVVVSGGLLRADHGGFGRVLGARAHVSKFFGAERPFATQLGNDHRARQNQLLALFVPERNCPAAVFVEAFNGVNQVSVESVAAHLAVGDHFHPCENLQVDAFVDGPVFHLLERSVRELSRREPVASFLKIRGTQETSDYITAIHDYLHERRIIETTWFDGLTPPRRGSRGQRSGHHCIEVWARPQVKIIVLTSGMLQECWFLFRALDRLL